jgi:hypothetical protein
MEPEDSFLLEHIKKSLADSLTLSLLSLRLEKHGKALLFALYVDTEVLIELFHATGRLFTEQDIRSLYRKYFRGERCIVDQPSEEC